MKNYYKSILGAYDRLETFRRKVINCNKKWKNIKNAERIFNVTQNNYPELIEMEDELQKLGTLYDLYMAVLKQKEEWKEMQFNELAAKKEENGVVEAVRLIREVMER